MAHTGEEGLPHPDQTVEDVIRAIQQLSTSSTEESRGWRTEAIGTEDARRRESVPVLAVREGLPRLSGEALHRDSHP